MKFSFAQAACCVTLTLGILDGLRGPSQCGLDRAGRHLWFQELDTSFGYYQ